MKTTQNIIKVETNRLKGTTTTNTNNYQNSPEAFNKYFLSIIENIIHDIYMIYRVSQEERAKLREGVPYVKLYRYNPKHLYPKLNG